MAREQAKIHDMGSFMSMLRLNRFQTDALSEGSPANAIAARYDLEPLPGSAASKGWTCRATGAVDAKAIDFTAFKEGACWAVNGPTTDDQPVFSWSTFCPQTRNDIEYIGDLKSGVKTADTAKATVSPHNCDVSHEGLVDTFDFSWQYLRPTSVRREAFEDESNGKSTHPSKWAVS
jgi:hypothetical protein